MKILVFLFFVVVINFASSQDTCPDGAPAVAECNRETRICDSDTSLGCNKFGETYYCCGSSKEPSKEDPNCYDTNKNCDNIKSLCSSDSLEVRDIVKLQCKKTCGFCGDNNVDETPKTPKTPNKPSHDDYVPICPTNGFTSYAKCNQTTKVCDEDPTMKCYDIKGTQWCCDPPAKEDPNCYDTHPNCASIDSLCHSLLLSGMLQQKCAKTCGYCGKPGSPMKFPWEYEIPICPTNGFMSFSKCNQTTKHCDADPSMSCYEIDGTQWCCDPPLEDRDCYDVHSHCRKFEHFCSSVLLDDTMRDLCPKTCGFCTPKTKSNDKPDDNKCIDNNNNCQELEDLCHSEDISDVMRFDCKKTCGFCGNDVDVKSKDPKKPEQCVDTNPNCPKLTDLCNDESQFTQDLMKTQCKHSCGFCKGGETLQQPKIPDNDCMDLNVNCENVADVCNNDNVELRNLMKSQCKRTCGFCGNDSNIKPTPPKQQPNKGGCVDNNNNCERIKGMCESSEPYVRTFMLQKCQKTCGLCNNKQKNQTKASKSVNKH